MGFAFRRTGALLVVSAVILTACSHEAKPKPAPSAAKNTTAVGVAVSGAFGAAPTLTVPGTDPPATLTQQTISQGSGATVVKGDTVVVNYLGQTWAAKDGKANVFDSSFSHGSAAAFVIGAGRVIPGWDKTLVGKKLGSRVVLTVPPADGYGSTGQPNAGITANDTLIFVVDLIAAYKPDASAPGTVVKDIPATGLPKIINVPGMKPQIISTDGVPTPNTPVSTLVVAGSGPEIDDTKMLMLQFVQCDLATGKNTQATWGQGPQSLPAANAIKIASKLAGQRIGARVIVLLPPTAEMPASSSQQAQPAVPAQVVVIDVVGQF